MADTLLKKLQLLVGESKVCQLFLPQQTKTLHQLYLVMNS